MLIISSFLVIFLEASLPIKGSFMGVSLAYFAYAITMKRALFVPTALLTCVIMSLQTDNIIKNALVLCLLYLAIRYIYAKLGYFVRNVVWISLAQILAYCLINFPAISIKWLVLNWLFIIIFNCIYVDHYNTHNKFE